MEVYHTFMQKFDCTFSYLKKEEEEFMGAAFASSLTHSPNVGCYGGLRCFDNSLKGVLEPWLPKGPMLSVLKRYFIWVPRIVH